MGISLQNVPVLPGAAVDKIELREKNEEKEEKNAENVNVYKKAGKQQERKEGPGRKPGLNRSSKNGQ